MHHFDDGSQSRPGLGPGRDRAKAARLTEQDLTQPIGRAQRHSSRQPAVSRDLPGLMQSVPNDAQDPSPSPVRLPLARPPVDGGPASGDGRVVPANGQGKLAESTGGRQAYQGANGTALRSVYSTAPQAGPDFMTIADGMAIAPKVSVVLPVMNEAAN